jgi:hypothetical protein
VEVSYGGVLMRLTTLLLVLGLFPLLACSPMEQKARDAAAALSGSIVAAQGKYQAACQANPSLDVCRLINRGVSAENALITAIETYCGWATTPAPPDANAPCVPVKSAEEALRVGIANAAALTSQIKGVI